MCELFYDSEKKIIFNGFIFHVSLINFSSRIYENLSNYKRKYNNKMNNKENKTSESHFFRLKFIKKIYIYNTLMLDKHTLFSLCVRISLYFFAFLFVLDAFNWDVLMVYRRMVRTFFTLEQLRNLRSENAVSFRSVMRCFLLFTAR